MSWSVSILIIINCKPSPPAPVSIAWVNTSQISTSDPRFELGDGKILLIHGLQTQRAKAIHWSCPAWQELLICVEKISSWWMLCCPVSGDPGAVMRLSCPNCSHQRAPHPAKHKSYHTFPAGILSYADSHYPPPRPDQLHSYQQPQLSHSPILVTDQGSSRGGWVIVLGYWCWGKTVKLRSEDQIGKFWP